MGHCKDCRYYDYVMDSTGEYGECKKSFPSKSDQSDVDLFEDISKCPSDKSRDDEVDSIRDKIVRIADCEGWGASANIGRNFGCIYFEKK